jgi:hypothetical protein
LTVVVAGAASAASGVCLAVLRPPPCCTFINCRSVLPPLYPDDAHPDDASVRIYA